MENSFRGKEREGKEVFLGGPGGGEGSLVVEVEGGRRIWRKRGGLGRRRYYVGIKTYCTLPPFLSFLFFSHRPFPRPIQFYHTHLILP